MIRQKDQKFYQIRHKDVEFSKTVHNWLALCDEEDNFLCGKVSHSLPEFTEEE